MDVGWRGTGGTPFRWASDVDLRRRNAADTEGLEARLLYCFADCALHRTGEAFPVQYRPSVTRPHGPGAGHGAPHTSAMAWVGTRTRFRPLVHSHAVPFTRTRPGNPCCDPSLSFSSPRTLRCLRAGRLGAMLPAGDRHALKKECQRPGGVSPEPPDDLSCLTTPGVGRPGDGAVAHAVDQVHPDAHPESMRGFADFSTDLCALV